MDKLAKTIRGLECCQIPFKNCYEKGCPYYENVGCKIRLRDDVLSLLKAQEPHVMTLEDVEDALDTVVWVDRPMLENTSSEYALIDSYSRVQKIVVLQYPFNSEYKERSDYATYGKRWRCWNVRPTDEQRKAVKWE